MKETFLRWWKWSEKKFKRISDGRLKRGWADMVAINDLQEDVCTASSHGPQLSAPRTYTAQFHALLPASLAFTTLQLLNPREEYSNDSDGRPCTEWNWDDDCGFNESHGSLPTRFLHNCAWCTYPYKTQAMHRGQDCMKKRHFRERVAASSVSASHDVSVAFPFPSMYLCPAPKSPASSVTLPPLPL